MWTDSELTKTILRRNSKFRPHNRFCSRLKTEILKKWILAVFRAFWVIFAGFSILSGFSGHWEVVASVLTQIHACFHKIHGFWLKIHHKKTVFGSFLVYFGSF